jgi:hypothetical protein
MILDKEVFFRSKLPLQKGLFAILFWSRKYLVSQLAFEGEIRENTTVDNQ